MASKKPAKKPIKKPIIKKSTKKPDVRKHENLSTYVKHVQNKFDLEKRLLTLSSEEMVVSELANELKVPPSKIIQYFFNKAIMLNANAQINKEQILEYCIENNIDVNFAASTTRKDVIGTIMALDLSKNKSAINRPPIVTIMGHVDHGKTTLLDTIRKANVVKGEVGGITQKIGAYQTKYKNNTITFIDTPGHEIFSEMRARGSKVTDLAIIVVAADDSIMNQTRESIDHVRAAKVPFIIAINKIDKEGLDIEKVKAELAAINVIAEEYGGDVPFVPVSAKTGKGIDMLLETIILLSQVLDLKSDPSVSGRGTVLESRVDKSKGPIATLLISNGTLKAGDKLIVGSDIGKIRKMTNENGVELTEATPSMPVEITGIPFVPMAGSFFLVVNDDKEAKKVVKEVQDAERKKVFASKIASVDNSGKKQLNLIIKADLNGSIEAIKSKIGSLGNEEVKIILVRSDIGQVNQADVLLAQVTDSMIYTFNVLVDPNVHALMKERNIGVKNFNIIYELFDAIELVAKGMKEPVFKETKLGSGEVRKVFSFSKIGNIAGSIIKSGEVVNNARARLFRKDKEIFDGEIASLRVEKDSVKKVGNGKECGITFKNFNAFQEGDTFDVYRLEQI